MTAAVLGGASASCGSTPSAPADATESAVWARTETVGLSIDADGYTVTLDGTQSRSIGANDPVTFTGVQPGEHVLEISGVAANCLVSSENPVRVDVPSGGSRGAVFKLLCMAPLPDHVEIAVTGVLSGGFGIPRRVYGMRANGSDPVDLTGHTTGDPAWSPDGSKLAFVSSHYDENGDIYVVASDATGLIRLTDFEGVDEQPAWSPDGSRIAFERGG